METPPALVLAMALCRQLETATVTAVEYRGADSILSCAAGTQSLAVRVPGRVDLSPGATVHLYWSKDAVHIFDPERGGERA